MVRGCGVQGIGGCLPGESRNRQGVVEESDVTRMLGVDINASEIAGLLEKLEFTCKVQGKKVEVTVPDFRLDIGEGLTGKADILEEIARLYGYDRIPETRLADVMPPQYGNPSLDMEEKLRDVMANLGLQEVVSYRLTTPEREARLNPVPSDQFCGVYYFAEPDHAGTKGDAPECFGQCDG